MRHNDSEFISNEHKGRKMLKDVLIKNFDNVSRVTDAGMDDPLDLYATINGDFIGYEVKMRNKMYKDMCLEAQKWEHIQDIVVKLRLDDFYYVNIIEGVAYFWSYDTIERYGSEPYYKAMPKTTSDKNKNYMIDKLVIGLPISKADFKFNI